MKRQINPSIKAYFIRGAFCLLLLLPVCLIPFALGQLDTALNSTMSDNGVEIQNSNGSLVTIGNTIFKVSPGGHSIVNDSGTSTSRGYNISNDDGGGYLNGPGDQIKYRFIAWSIAGQWWSYIHTRLVTRQPGY